MKKLTLLCAVLLVVTLGWSGSAQAITNGQPDGNGHPFVGLVTDFEFVCSGSAISPTKFITAAHCFDTPGKAVSVSFDTNAQFSANPPPPTYHTGHWYPDPQFCIACAKGLPGFDTHDVAVVIFDAPVTLPGYASLPSQGQVDTLPMGTDISIVGYGVQNFLRGGGQPRPDRSTIFIRYFAANRLIQSNNSISGEFLKLSANPGQGKGGTCFGDSGGPNLLGNSTTILGVNSFVTNGNCTGVTYSYRIDTAAALSYINSVN
jgi:hypothetical protein